MKTIIQVIKDRCWGTRLVTTGEPDSIYWLQLVNRTQFISYKGIIWYLFLTENWSLLTSQLISALVKLTSDRKSNQTYWSWHKIKLEKTMDLFCRLDPDVAWPSTWILKKRKRHLHATALEQHNSHFLVAFTKYK